MAPQRIVCLTEEPTETLYLLGQQHRIVGISGFTVRPPEARREKPKVSAFLSAKIDKILALKPDLAIGFSDLQADIAQALIKAGVEVWVANHRSVAGILDYIRRLGALVGESGQADRLADRLAEQLSLAKHRATHLKRRPKVYFEEWDTPQISGIRWVSELVEIAGGIDIFPELSREPMAKNRIVTTPEEVIRRAPDIIFGSWCGKRFQPSSVAGRSGWEAIPAVKYGDLFEVKSPIILQPGPAALTDGLKVLQDRIFQWSERHG